MAAFKQTFSEFCQQQPEARRLELSPEAMAMLTKGLMAAAQAAGKTGLATYLHNHDVRAPSVSVDGVKYRFKNTMDKTILTLFGDVVVNRSIYANDLLRGGYVAPLDRAIGVDGNESATLEAREIVLFAASTNTPEEVATLLGKASLCRPSRTAIQNIIARDGQRMELHREDIAEAVRQTQPIPQEARVVVASLDGANVRLREPGVKKGRKAQRPRQECDDGGDSPSSFRNAMVGCFSFYGRDENGQAERINSTYLARMPEDNATTFKHDFDRTVMEINAKLSLHGPDIDKILLCDGHRGIWSYAGQSEPLKDYTWCIDFYHTTEHLSKAAEAIFGAKSPAGNSWYHKWREALKTDPDAPKSIIRSIAGYRERHRMSKARLDALDKELTFFKRNHRLMRYAQFLRKGYPIGSGPVEAAAKTIVKQRMCRSGMRWNRTTGQHVLTLRAYAKSGKWDVMWQKYTELRLAA